MTNLLYMLYHLDDDTDSMGVPALGHAIDQLAQAAMAMIPPPGGTPLTPLNTNSGPTPNKSEGQPLMPKDSLKRVNSTLSSRSVTNTLERKPTLQRQSSHASQRSQRGGLASNDGKFQRRCNKSFLASPSR